MHHLGYDLPSFSGLPMQIKHSFPRLWKSMINGSLPVQGKKLELLLTDALSQLIVQQGENPRKVYVSFHTYLGKISNSAVFKMLVGWFYIEDYTTHLSGDFFRSQQK